MNQPEFGTGRAAAHNEVSRTLTSAPPAGRLPKRAHNARRDSALAEPPTDRRYRGGTSRLEQPDVAEIGDVFAGQFRCARDKGRIAIGPIYCRAGSALRWTTRPAWDGASGSHDGPSADVEVHLANFFTPALRARVLSPMPGYEQRGLNVYRFTVASDRKIGQCRYEEQRGRNLLATYFCLAATREIFDPPFSAFDKDGVARGWHIMRVLLKTGH
jgi:hypothetical protein